MFKVFPALWERARWRLLPVWLNYMVAIVWSYTMAVALLAWAVHVLASALDVTLPWQWTGFSPIPQVWGATLGLTYLVQALLSMLIDERLERGLLPTLFWIVWYPLAFWTLQAATAVVGLPRALWRGRPERGTWVSPDRGIR